MTDEFEFWRNALSGCIGDIHPDDPQPGYYKTRLERNGPFIPVAIWRKDGNLVCRVGRTMRDPHDIWTWCAKSPVKKEDAKHAFETGIWPGDVPRDVPQSGHNAGTLSLEDEINDAAELALAWLEKNGIKDKTASDMAANWRAKLLDLGKRADKDREAEKAPHLAASRAVDAKYKPWIERAQSAANRLRDALTVWMRAEEAKLEAERRKKYEAELKAAEATRLRAEAAREKLMADDPIAALTSPEPDIPELPLAPEAVKIQAGGQRGRKAGLRTVTRYVVTDYDAAYAAVRDHDDVRAAIEKVAAARAKTGVVVPGVEAISEKVAA